VGGGAVAADTNACAGIRRGYESHARRRAVGSLIVDLNRARILDNDPLKRMNPATRGGEIR